MKRSPSPSATHLPSADAAESCGLCAADVIHCHEVSVEHADGSTAHHLHEWQLACDAFAPPCPCAAADHGLDLALPRAA
jgi:hypothetical protein